MVNATQPPNIQQPPVMQQPPHSQHMYQQQAYAPTSFNHPPQMQKFDATSFKIEDAKKNDTNKN